MTAALTEWTEQDSADLTAELIVSGAHMNAAHLDELELAATVRLAYAKRVRRSDIAHRIGWRTDRLWQWCRRNGLAFNEDHFPDTGRGHRKRRPT
jgi:hypothetical protein